MGIRAALLLLAVTCSAVSLTLEEQPEHELARLPLFVGKGYNIFKGNPYSQGNDPGFRYNALGFSYAGNAQTSDGLYLVPDGVSTTKLTSCFSTFEKSSYRGTQSYQNDLKVKASVGGGVEMAAFAASFSLSTGFQQMENKTVSEKKIVTKASSECEFYDVQMSLYQTKTIDPNFKAGAIDTIKTKNWVQFIEEFGTHYVKEVRMGGRATQYIEYSENDVAELKAIGISVEAAAEARFKMVSVSASAGTETEKKQASYSNSFQETSYILYLGGVPPVNDNIPEWRVTVKNELSPISYKLWLLSDLFDSITEITDKAAAKKSFEDGIAEYCRVKGCKSMTPDAPMPQPATIVFTDGTAYGGEGGYAFRSTMTNPNLRLTKVILRSASLLDSIQLQFSDGVTSDFTPRYGGMGGQEKVWEVPPGDEIIKIELRTGQFVDSIRFYTKKGVTSPTFGGTGGFSKWIEVPSGQKIMGFHGRSASLVDKLGFVFGKIVF